MYIKNLLKGKDRRLKLTLNNKGPVTRYDSDCNKILSHVNTVTDIHAT